MWDYEDDYYEDYYSEKKERSSDKIERKAEGVVHDFFEENKENVFFSRQVEIRHEHIFFHWITNRAIRTLIENGEILSETRRLKTGGDIKLLWNKNYRYYKRSATEVIKLVEEYANPNIGAALGLHGEMMVLEGFARNQFLLLGREVNSINNMKWEKTGHDIDLIFERDGIKYGIEVKNTLGYMDYKELLIKVEMCLHLGIKPVFVVRMLPKSWIYEVSKSGGFVLILKYQLYPWTHSDLANKVATNFGLPVDAPRALEEGTMERFMVYHRKNM